MAKTNFTKVEDALSEGLRRMTVSGLLGMATTASQIGTPQHSSALSAAHQKRLLAAASFEVKYCKDEQLFAACGLSKHDLKKLLDNPAGLSPDEWAALKTFRENVDAYKKAHAANSPADADEKLVEVQRKKHINKRYNTKEQWLPLH